MNAFNDILGHAGNVADAVFLGGAVGKSRRRNAFSDMIEGGDYQGAQDLALRNRAPEYAKYASELAQSKQDQEAARSDEFDQNLVNLAAHLDSVQDPQMRMSTIQTMMPFYVKQGMIDPGDVDFIMQAAQTPGGLSALVGLNTPSQDQFSNRMDMRKADQADFQNQTGRINAQVGVTNAQTSQERLGLDRQRFAEDQRQFDVTSSQAEDKMALDREQFSAKSAAVGPRDDVTARQTLAAAIERVDRLAAGGDLNQGFRASYGFRRPGFTVLPGSDRRNAEALIDQIAGGLTLEEANALKGVLSDRDMELLARSASRLNNRDISDEEAAMALQEVKAMLQAKLEALGTQQSAPSQAGQYSPDNPFAPR